MRIPTLCWLCTDNEDAYLLDLANDGAYQASCRYGHRIEFALQNMRHEVIFESGIVAMSYGFNREAVTSFATALERFFEFGIRCMLEHAGVGADEVETAWKPLAANSQRQLGAFFLLYAAAFGRPFSVPAGCRSFNALEDERNKFVHKGVIPMRDQAERFARDVFSIVKSVIDDLVGLDEAAVKTIERRTGAHSAHQQLAKKTRGLPAQQNADGLFTGPAGMSWAMMLSRHHPSGPQTFDERLVYSRTLVETARFVESRMRPEGAAGKKKPS